MTEIISGWTVFKNTYDKKGRLKETKVYNKSSSWSKDRVYAADKMTLKNIMTYTFDKKNRMTSRLYKEANGELIEASYYGYNNKNQAVREYYEDTDTKGKVLIRENEYDKKGNTTKEKGVMKDYTKHLENIYSSNNLLTKKIETETDSAETMAYDRNEVTTYKYKKIAVDQAALEVIKAQQRTLVNNEQNGSIVNHYYLFQ